MDFFPVSSTSSSVMSGKKMQIIHAIRKTRRGITKTTIHQSRLKWKWIAWHCRISETFVAFPSAPVETFVTVTVSHSRSPHFIRSKWNKYSWADDEVESIGDLCKLITDGKRFNSMLTWWEEASVQFNEFSADRLIESSRTQKMFDRTLQEPSIGGKMNG